MKIGHSQEESDIYIYIFQPSIFQVRLLLKFQGGYNSQDLSMLLEVVYHWSRPPPPWSHLHGFSDQTFSKDDRRGKFTTILWEHKTIYPCKQGSGAAIFLIFQFDVVDFEGKGPIFFDGFQLLWLQVLPEVPPASVPRLNLEVPDRDLTLGVQKSLGFFFVSKNQMPRELVFHMYLFIHTKTNKKINPPQKTAFQSPVVHSRFGSMGSMAGGRFYGKKTIPLCGASTFVGIRRLRG